MVPSRCSPPANCTSPWTLAALPTRVSIRGDFGSRVNIAVASGCVESPGEGLGGRRDVLVTRAHFDGHVLGLESGRQGDFLVHVLEISEVEGQLALLAGGETGELRHRGLAVAGGS